MQLRPCPVNLGPRCGLSDGSGDLVRSWAAGAKDGVKEQGLVVLPFLAF